MWKASSGGSPGISKVSISLSGSMRLNLAFAQHDRWLAIFVDQSFDREHELVIEWRLGIDGQSADIDLQRLGLAADAAHKFAGKNRSHARRESAIGCKGDAGLLGLLRKVERLADDDVVSAQIGEVTFGFDGGFCESQVEEIREQQKDKRRARA